MLGFPWVESKTTYNLSEPPQSDALPHFLFSFPFQNVTAMKGEGFGRDTCQPM